MKKLMTLGVIVWLFLFCGFSNSKMNYTVEEDLSDIRLGEIKDIIENEANSIFDEDTDYLSANKDLKMIYTQGKRLYCVWRNVSEQFLIRFTLW